ncbi:NnrU family protein [Faunimonas sp. B44]|uniref:NnrU family protein n=1 Tax=Faunimonas sp. B44 TaxID=3461493 RepID=UPI004044D50D
MTEFVAAIAVFLLAHVIPAATGLRGRLIAALGRPLYIGLYAVLSLVLLGWVILAAARAPYIELWPPSPATAAVPLIVMPFASALFGAALAEPNPLSVGFRGAPDAARIGGVLAITRHPLLWAFLLWAASHLVANGDLVSVLLFGAFAIFAWRGMAVADRRARQKLGEAAWSQAARRTSALPFAALLAGRAPPLYTTRSAVGAALGLVAYALLVADGHLRLFGADPLAWWR